MALVIKRKKASSWILYIWQRIRNKKNFIAFTSGPTGSGKSMACLRIAEEVDPSFHIGRVVFSPKELMQVINNGKLKKGSCIIFEEAGVGISNRDWYTQTNKMLNFLVQTFRHRNFILILNAPYMDFIDKATRKLFHAEFQMTGIDFNKKTSTIKPQLLQYNGRYQKWYFKYLKVLTPDGVVPLTKWNVELPSKDLIESYEKRKRAFTDTLNLEISKSLSDDKEKPKKQKAVCQKCAYDWQTGKNNPCKCPKCGSPRTIIAPEEA